MYGIASLRTHTFLTVFLLIFLAGCTVKLISSYDETTDRDVTALQRKVEEFLVTLDSQQGPPTCAYQNHKDFYLQAKVDLSAIAVRVAAIPKNEITIEQVRLLADSLDKLEQLHKIACLSAQQIQALRTAFNASFTAILKLELAKKRGQAN